MGWSDCGTDEEGRPIGYVHVAVCDHPGCYMPIDRGLSYACGGMHGFNEHDCDKYFCSEHLFCADTCYLCRECYDVWDRQWEAQKFLSRTMKQYDNEETKDLAIKGVFSHFSELRESNMDAMRDILGELTFEDMTTELMVTFAMAANVYLGKDEPARNSFCRFALEYFDETGMDKEDVRAIFMNRSKKDD